MRVPPQGKAPGHCRMQLTSQLQATVTHMSSHCCSRTLAVCASPHPQLQAQTSRCVARRAKQRLTQQCDWVDLVLKAGSSTYKARQLRHTEDYKRWNTHIHCSSRPPPLPARHCARLHAPLKHSPLHTHGLLHPLDFGEKTTYEGQQQPMDKAASPRWPCTGA